MDGYEQPVTMTMENWYSPELRTNILSVTDDPRTGHFVMRLTEISTDEPPASMFEIPAASAVKQETVTRVNCQYSRLPL